MDSNVPNILVITPVRHVIGLSAVLESEVLEDCLGKKAKKIYLPMQDGDVTATNANVDDLVRDFDFKPSTSIEKGLENFVKWYRWYN